MEDFKKAILAGMFATPNKASNAKSHTEKNKGSGNENEDEPCILLHFAHVSNPELTSQELSNGTADFQSPQRKETGQMADFTPNNIRATEQVLNKETVYQFEQSLVQDDDTRGSAKCETANEKGTKPRIQKAVSEQLTRKLKRARSYEDCTEEVMETTQSKVNMLKGQSEEVVHIGYEETPKGEVTERRQNKANVSKGQQKEDELLNTSNSDGDMHCKTLVESITRGGKDQIGPRVYTKDCSRIQKAVSKQLTRKLKLKRPRNNVDCAEGVVDISDKEVTEIPQNKADMSKGQEKEDESLNTSCSYGDKQSKTSPESILQRRMDETDAEDSPSSQIEAKNTGQDNQEDKKNMIDCTDEFQKLQIVSEQMVKAKEAPAAIIQKVSQSNTHEPTVEASPEQQKEITEKLKQDYLCRNDGMKIYKDLRVELVNIEFCLENGGIFTDALGKANKTSTTTQPESSFGSKMVELLIKQHEDWRDWNLEINSERRLVLRNGKSVNSSESLTVYREQEESVENIYRTRHFYKTQVSASPKYDTMKTDFKEKLKRQATEFEHRGVATKRRMQEQQCHKSKMNRDRKNEDQGQKSGFCLEYLQAKKKLGTLQMRVSSVPEDVHKHPDARKAVKSIHQGFRWTKSFFKLKRCSKMERKRKQFKKMTASNVRKMKTHSKSNDPRQYNKNYKKKHWIPRPQVPNQTAKKNSQEQGRKRENNNLPQDPKRQRTLKIRECFMENLAKYVHARNVKSKQKDVRKTMEISKQESQPEMERKENTPNTSTESQVSRSYNLDETYHVSSDTASDDEETTKKLKRQATDFDHQVVAKKRRTQEQQCSKSKMIKDRKNKGQDQKSAVRLEVSQAKKKLGTLQMRGSSVPEDVRKHLYARKAGKSIHKGFRWTKSFLKLKSCSKMERKKKLLKIMAASHVPKMKTHSKSKDSQQYNQKKRYNLTKTQSSSKGSSKMYYNRGSSNDEDYKTGMNTKNAISLKNFEKKHQETMLLQDVPQCSKDLEMLYQKAKPKTSANVIPNKDYKKGMNSKKQISVKDYKKKHRTQDKESKEVIQENENCKIHLHQDLPQCSKDLEMFQLEDPRSQNPVQDNFALSVKSKSVERSGNANSSKDCNKGNMISNDYKNGTISKRRISLEDYKKKPRTQDNKSKSEMIQQNENSKIHLHQELPQHSKDLEMFHLEDPRSQNPAQDNFALSINPKSVERSANTSSSKDYKKGTNTKKLNSLDYYKKRRTQHNKSKSEMIQQNEKGKIPLHQDVPQCSKDLEMFHLKDVRSQNPAQDNFALSINPKTVERSGNMISNDYKNGTISKRRISLEDYKKKPRTQDNKSKSEMIQQNENSKIHLHQELPQHSKDLEMFHLEDPRSQNPVQDNFALSINPKTVERSGNVISNDYKNGTISKRRISLEDYRKYKQSQGERNERKNKIPLDLEGLSKPNFKVSRNGDFRRKKLKQYFFKMENGTKIVVYRKKHRKKRHGCLDPNAYHASIEFTNPEYIEMCKHIENSIKEDKISQSGIFSRSFNSSMCHAKEDANSSQSSTSSSESPQETNNLRNQKFTEKRCSKTQNETRNSESQASTEAEITKISNQERKSGTRKGYGEAHKPTQPSEIVQESKRVSKTDRIQSRSSQRDSKRRTPTRCHERTTNKRRGDRRDGDSSKDLKRDRDKYPDNTAKRRRSYERVNERSTKTEDGKINVSSRRRTPDRNVRERRLSRRSRDDFKNTVRPRNTESASRNRQKDGNRTRTETSTVTRQETQLPDPKSKVAKAKDPRLQTRMRRESQNANAEAPPTLSQEEKPLKEGQSGEVNNPANSGIWMHVFDRNRQRINQNTKEESVCSWFELWIKSLPSNTQKSKELQRLTRFLTGSANSYLVFREWGYVTQSLKSKSFQILSFKDQNNKWELTVYITAYMHVGLYVCVRELSESPNSQREKSFIVVGQYAEKNPSYDGRFETCKPRESYEVRGVFQNQNERFNYGREHYDGWPGNPNSFKPCLDGNPGRFNYEGRLRRFYHDGWTGNPNSSKPCFDGEPGRFNYDGRSGYPNSRTQYWNARARIIRRQLEAQNGVAAPPKTEAPLTEDV
ncbi:hypothetical protein NL108_018632 [Boleophthalmus pectinirostris]|nr:hypothetical protein NL108_018632 [Boleophthalmus pectinirostris]